MEWGSDIFISHNAVCRLVHHQTPTSLALSEISMCNGLLLAIDQKTHRHHHVTAHELMSPLISNEADYPRLYSERIPLGPQLLESIHVKLLDCLTTCVLPHETTTATSEPHSHSELKMAALPSGTITPLQPRYPCTRSLFIHLQGQCLWISFPSTPINNTYMQRWMIPSVNSVEFLVGALRGGMEMPSFSVIERPAAFILPACSYTSVLVLDTTIYLHTSLMETTLDLPQHAQIFQDQLLCAVQDRQLVPRLSVCYAEDTLGVLVKTMSNPEHKDRDGMELLDRLKTYISALVV